MRYILYLFTLGLVFTAGMLVGNFYIPARNTTLAAAVSVPDLDRVNPALDQATLQQARQNIAALTQALDSCPVVVEAERDRLFKQMTLFLALQDFELKKSVYEAEIAKNAANTRPTAQFSNAAAAYSEAKTRTERLADELFPPQIPQTQPSSATAAAVSSSTVVLQQKEDPKTASRHSLAATAGKAETKSPGQSAAETDKAPAKEPPAKMSKNKTASTHTAKAKNK